jgi:hypothetical protein
VKLPPLSQWRKKSYAATEATGAGISMRWFGNVQIDHTEPGDAHCNVSLFKFQKAGAKPPPGWSVMSKPPGKGWQRIEREIKAGQTKTKWGSYFPSAGAARKAAQAHLDAHPTDYVAWPLLKWPPASMRRPGDHGYQQKAAYKGSHTPKASKMSTPGYEPGTTVRLKVTGGQQDHPLFIGLDSKGRSKYELIPPKGKTARAVAREFRKAAEAGKPVLGGTVYSIRFYRDGSKQDYWTNYKLKWWLKIGMHVVVKSTGQTGKVTFLTSGALAAPGGNASVKLDGGGSVSVPYSDLEEMPKASKAKPKASKPKHKPFPGKTGKSGGAAFLPPGQEMVPFASQVIEKYTPDKAKLVKKAVLWAHPTHGQIMLKRIPKWVDLPGEPDIQGPNPEVTALFKAGWKPVKLKNPHRGRRY